MPTRKYCNRTIKGLTTVITINEPVEKLMTNA